MVGVLYQVIHFEDILDVLRERTKFYYYFVDENEVVIIAKPCYYKGPVPEEYRKEWDALRASRGIEISGVFSEIKLVTEI